MPEGLGEIKLIPRKEISKEKWEKLLTYSEYPIFSSTWYLDVVAPGWQAFVLDDYELVFPVLFKQKLNLCYSLNSLLIRSFEILGKSNSLKREFLKAILNKFDFFALNFTDTHETEFFDGTREIRKFQYLRFKENYQQTCSLFSENTRRKIKQFALSNSKIEEIKEVERLSKMFKREIGFKFKEFNNDTYKKIDKLVKSSKQQKKGYLYGAICKDELVAIGFFILENNHLLYVKGVVTEAGKKIGAMHALFNFVISNFHDKTKGLDFGGSNELGLADFNKRFGSEDRDYFVLKDNKTKFPIRQIINRKLGL
jgi:hypothetical protein